MPKAPLHHVSLEVTDVARARWFYDRFLGPIGYRRFVSGEEYLGYTDGTLTFWIMKSHQHRVRRHPPTGEEEVIAEHLAFRLPSPEAVIEREAELAREEIFSFFRPESHPEFSAGYFSASWVDPDGIVLELYSLPERRPRSRRPSATRRASPRPAHRAARRPRARRRA